MKNNICYSIKNDYFAVFETVCRKPRIKWSIFLAWFELNLAGNTFQIIERDALHGGDLLFWQE